MKSTSTRRHTTTVIVHFLILIMLQILSTPNYWSYLLVVHARIRLVHIIRMLVASIILNISLFLLIFIVPWRRLVSSFNKFVAVICTDRTLAARFIEWLSTLFTFPLVSSPTTATWGDWWSLNIRIYLLWSDQEGIWFIVYNSDLSCWHYEFVNEFINWIATIASDVKLWAKILAYPRNNFRGVDSHRELFQHLIKQGKNLF